MRLNKWMVAVGALTVALSAGSLSAEPAQRAGRDRDQGGRQSQGAARERDSRGGDDRNRSNDDRARPSDRRDNSRTDGRRPEVSRGPTSRNDVYRNDGYRNDGYRNDGRRYAVPRGAPYRTPYRHYYGSGGHLSVYFGIGSGYRYGSFYSGRVYGRPSPYYRGGGRLYYGDVRLLVRPRGAAVYVDGYYAGIVDDFDGVFQRLTIEVGPHEIEVEAPGFEPQVFNVYVDASRTVDLRGDLFPDR